MSAFIAPYLRRHDRIDGTTTWIFTRPGYTVRLPALFSDRGCEPWYSPHYTAALRASGMNPLRVRLVLQELPFSLAAAIRNFKASGQLSDRASSTVAQFDMYADVLCAGYGWADIRHITPVSVAGMIGRMPDRRIRLSILRRVLRHAAGCGQISTNPAANMDNAGPASACAELGRTIRGEEYRAVQGEFGNGSAERAVLAMLLHLGMPRSELRRLTPDNITRRVSGSPHPELHAAVREGMACLFPNRKRSINVSCVLRCLDEAAERMGLPKITAHNLRDLRAECTAALIAESA